VEQAHLNMAQIKKIILILLFIVIISGCVFSCGLTLLGFIRQSRADHSGCRDAWISSNADPISTAFPYADRHGGVSTIIHRGWTDPGYRNTWQWESPRRSCPNSQPSTSHSGKLMYCFLEPTAVHAQQISVPTLLSWSR